MRSLVALGSAAILVAVAAACSGGHGGTTTLPMHAGAAIPGATNTTAPQSAKVSIKIPSRSSSNVHMRRTKYVSASTEGATLTVYASTSTPPASPTVVIDLTSSSNCTTNSDGSRTCTISVSAPVGNDVFVFNTYDQPPSNGAIPQNANLLSTATLDSPVSLGGSNTLNLTLDGVVSSISISPSGYLVPPNSATALSVNVNASDPDGNTIVGPGSYVDANGNPLTISLAVNNDPNGTISLSTTSVTAPGTSVTATYNGGTLAGTASVTASSGNLSSSLTTQVNDFISTAQTLIAGQPTPTATPTPVPSSSATATPTPTATPSATATPRSSINANNDWFFDGRSIASGDTLWFTSDLKIPGGLSSSTTINMTNATITIYGANTYIVIPVPNFSLFFSSSATTSSLNYDPGSGWSEIVPLSTSNNVLIGAVAYPVTTTIPSNIDWVEWKALFTSPQSGPIHLQWRWSATVYNSSFTSAFNSLGYNALKVLPVAGSDTAGTPESYKTDLVSGGTDSYDPPFQVELKSSN